jgi:hypothetical protein
MRKKILLAVYICGWLLLMMPVIGSAHTHFYMSEPFPDEILTTSPATVRLTFSSPVEVDFSNIVVKNNKGIRVDNKTVKQASDNPKILETGLPATLEPGNYHVDWSVASGDGHRVKGNFSFTIK